MGIQQALIAGTAAVIPTSPPVAGYIFWLDASQLAYANGATVTAWPDLSSASWPTTMNVVTGSLPTMQRTSMNGLPGVQFISPSDGASSSLTANNLINGSGGAPVATAATFFIVAKNLHQPPSDDARSAHPFGLSSGSSSFLGYSGGSNGYYYDNIFSSSRTSGALPTGFRIDLPYIYSKVANSSGSSATLNRVSLYTGSYTFGYNTDYFSIGVDNNNAAFTSNSVVAEVIVYRFALTGAQIISVNNYLQTKWGTP